LVVTSFVTIADKMSKQTTLYAGRTLTLVVEEQTLPDGYRGRFEIVRHPGGAAVLPILADGRLLLIRQYRPALGGMVVEIPAGRLEPGEDPARCAARELAEEVGYRAGRLVKLGELLSTVGFCDERIHLFAASELAAVPTAREAGEFIELLPLLPAEAMSMLRGGEIPDAKTQLALLHCLCPADAPVPA
jgi:ADP-ribose diphosphatase